jgi:uncharacterized membrane protein
MATVQAVAWSRLVRSTPALALVAGGTTLLAVAVAVAAAHPEASPLSPSHPGFDSTWAWLFLGSLSCAFLAYVAGLGALTRRGARLGAVVAISVAIQLVPLLGPVLLSTDLYTYWARGRVSAVHGENPYVVAPSSFPADPAYTRMGATWRDRPTGYGPAFTLLSEGHAAIVGSSAAAAAWLYRAVAAVAMIALVLLAAALARERAFAAAFVGWNPLLAIHFAGGGHNDALVMVLVLTALLLAARRRPVAAGGAWAAAVAVKWFPLLFLPLRALEARRTGRPVSHIGFVAVAGLIGLVAFWRYGADWLGGFGNFSDQLQRTTSLSTARWLTGLGIPEQAAIGLLLGIFAVGYAWLLLEAWRGRARLALCAGFLLLTTSWLVPWYAVWVVPLAAIEDDRAARLLAVGLSAYLLRGAVPL